MNEEQFLNIVSQMLLNAGYTKTRDALFEEAKARGFKITKKEIPLAKDLEIREPDVIRRSKRNEYYWNQPTQDDAFFKISVMDSDIRAIKDVNGWIYIVLYLENQKIGAFDHVEDRFELSSGNKGITLVFRLHDDFPERHNLQSMFSDMDMFDWKIEFDPRTGMHVLRLFSKEESK